MITINPPSMEHSFISIPSNLRPWGDKCLVFIEKRPFDLYFIGGTNSSGNAGSDFGRVRMDTGYVYNYNNMQRYRRYHSCGHLNDGHRDIIVVTGGNSRKTELFVFGTYDYDDFNHDYYEYDYYYNWWTEDQWLDGNVTGYTMYVSVRMQ